MQPLVSIIVPCYNEEKTIHKLLDSILAQTYPLGQLELLVSDGMSTDGTRAVIASFQDAHPQLNLRVVENSARTIPSGLNQAIRHARGELIIRLDAHSMPIPEYVERCVDAHRSGKGDNIGGVWDIRAREDTWVAESIACAAAHPLGVGDAMYRLNAGEGAVDTVPFGSFWRTLIDRIGFFDENLLANEDYEFNTRLRASGGVVWLDPSIRSIYFSRTTFSKLASQYWRYGYWKWRMIRRYPRTLRWRQALPPLFVLSLLVLIVLSLWFLPAKILLTAQALSYFGVLTLAGLILAVKEHKPFLVLGLPVAIATMHFAWGAGFLWSCMAGLFIRNG